MIPAPSIPDLIRKYNRPGPRYTSYPTALQFSPVEAIEPFLEDVAAGTGPLSLYFHVPFCETLCWYCGCHTVITRDPRLAEVYVEALRREIDLFRALRGTDRPVVQVHYGGGTPNFLDPTQIRALGNHWRSAFSLDPGAECGVELDPRTLTLEQVEAFRDTGFKRASFGVQDCNPEVQRAVHRVQPSEMNWRTLEWLRGAGFESINIDLIYGLPHQTRESFERTLDEVMAYNPDRLAVFSYAHVPWIKPAQKILEREGLPSPQEKLDMLTGLIGKLTGGGYVHIGMDHFAKEQDELALSLRAGTLHRNFQGYSTRAGVDICAFGISAISQTESSYRQNEKELPGYYNALRHDRLPVARGYRLRGDDAIRRALIMTIMCGGPLRFDPFAERYGVDPRSAYPSEIAALEPLARDGLVELGQEGIQVTTLGRLFVRNIAMVFDPLLDPAASGRHSRTV